MINKILVVNCNGIGDAILSTPILKSLRNSFPNSKITFMVSPIMRDIVEGLPFIDDVVTYEKGQPIVPVIRHIWRYDMALCLDFKYRSAVIPFLARIPIRAGLKHKRGLFMTHEVQRDPNDEQIYEPYNFANIVRQTTNISIEGDLTKLYVAPAIHQVKQNVDHLFNSLHLTPQDEVIAIAPFSSEERKDWPSSHYQQLINLLKKDQFKKIVILGSADDEARSNFENAHNWLGKTSLSEMAEVLRRCSLFIGNCSGPLHIAASVDVPIVAIYGSTSSNHWAPRSNTTVIKREVPCSPCDGRAISCAEYPCLKNIQVEEVFSACKQILNKISKQSITCK